MKVCVGCRPLKGGEGLRGEERKQKKNPAPCRLPAEQLLGKRTLLRSTPRGMSHWRFSPARVCGGSTVEKFRGGGGAVLLAGLEDGGLEGGW